MREVNETQSITTLCSTSVCTCLYAVGYNSLFIDNFNLFI